MPGKRIQFHKEVLSALEELAGDRMATLQELADEAFNDLLKKHDRPVGIRAMLKGSTVKEPDKSNVVKIRPRAKDRI
jgi:hypothetical protein